MVGLRAAGREASWLAGGLKFENYIVLRIQFTQIHRFYQINLTTRRLPVPVMDVPGVLTKLATCRRRSENGLARSSGLVAGVLVSYFICKERQILRLDFITLFRR